MEPNELLKKLPDFDDMNNVAEANAKAKGDLEQAKNLLSQEIARCIQEAMHNPDYWLDGKRPSMSYATNVIAVNGNTPEDAKILSALRDKIVELTETYQVTKQLLNNMETIVSVWQTYSANQRRTTL